MWCGGNDDWGYDYGDDKGDGDDDEMMVIEIMIVEMIDECDVEYDGDDIREEMMMMIWWMIMMTAMMILSS